MARNVASKMSWDKYVLRPVQGAAPVVLPTFIYGTAWKKDRTAELVHQALQAGFRAVDTAAQPKHYREDLVGEGIRRALRDGIVRREDLHYLHTFAVAGSRQSIIDQSLTTAPEQVQTKFTSIQGQSPDNMPYDPHDSVTAQVHASIQSSFRHLRPAEEISSADETYIDTLILHSPLSTMQQTLEAWTALESYVPHRIRSLGISNCTLPVLRELASRVSVTPAVVQNRFYAGTQFDVPLRSFCRANQIVYQSFWTLSANPELLRSEPVQVLASRAGIGSAAALYSLVLGLGKTTVLNGTTKRAHMEADLAALRTAETFAGENPEMWQRMVEGFQELTGDHVEMK